MIWNDDKINRMLSMGVMFGADGPGGEGPGGTGEADDAGESEAGAGGGSPGGDSDNFGSLSVDLGGGVTATIDSQTGDVTGFSGGSGEGVDAAEARATALDQPSAFGKALEKLQAPGTVGGILGLLAGPLVGLPPSLGAQVGKGIGGLFESPEEKAGVATPGTTQAPSQQAQQQPTAVAGVTPGITPSGLSGPPGQLGGGESRDTQAVNLAAAGRQSGIAPLGQQQQIPQFAGQMPQQRFLNQGGPIPTVNLDAFPRILGRV